MDILEIIIMKACGLDVHQATVVACIQRQGFEKIIRTFGTTTEELLDLKELLKQQQITHIAIESTGVYWKPVYNILADDAWEILLANARHMKNVPGRKTDVQDCEWIWKLLRAAATILFKALKKKTVVLHRESVVLPSTLVIRNSTSPIGTAFKEVQL